MWSRAILEQTIETKQTCNCLLSSGGERASGDDAHLSPFGLVSACYELASAEEATHVGSVTAFGEEGAPQTAQWEKRGQAVSLPGVFDITWVAAQPFRLEASSPPQSTAAGGARRLLLASCTDGSARLLHPSSLETVKRFPSIHSEMLTSCTPFFNTFTPDGSGLHLLCTAHTGAVLVYEVASAAVTAQLEGHEFDAWCSAVMPTTHGAAESASAGTRAEVPSCPPVLLSGGDDSLVKLYDMRAGYAACGRSRFDAGVVHIAPVVSTCQESCGEVMCAPTPYVLVGSYDASVSLIDIRFAKRPVAQRTGLDGGVWRCSRCIFPFYAETSKLLEGDVMSNYSLAAGAVDVAPTLPSSSFPERDALKGCAAGVVNEANTLLLPLMQRGAALLTYNVKESENNVFGVPQYFHRSGEGPEEGADEEAALTPEAVTDGTLVYDTAPLSVRWTNADQGRRTFQARVATCSFYEKRIDIWTLCGASK